jgi:hypothetical protein
MEPMSWTTLKPFLDEILKSSGPWAVLFVLVVMWHVRYVEYQAEKRLADKDREIERVAQERNRLQEIVLKSRKSSASK